MFTVIPVRYLEAMVDYFLDYLSRTKPLLDQNKACYFCIGMGTLLFGCVSYCMAKD